MVRAPSLARTALVTLAAGLMLGGQPPPALASVHSPTGLYRRFADCPLANPDIDNCVFATLSGGHVTVGHKTVPLNAPIVIQGGFYGGGSEVVFVGAEDGNTLSSPPLTVPGGITGLIAPESLSGSLRSGLERAQAGVTMTLQLARPAGTIQLNTEHFLTKEGIALRLPAKIKLNNPFLGGNCYIGSTANPLVLSLTTGVTSPAAPNKPIMGTSGHFESLDDFRLLILKDASLVDNSFTAPQATGCGGLNAPLINNALDAAIGLPSTTGHNTAILNGTFDIAATSAVHESE